jgi:hypothetical protein
MRGSGDAVIQLEFNELSPALMDKFIAEGKWPFFKKLRDESMVIVSEGPSGRRTSILGFNG